MIGRKNVFLSLLVSTVLLSCTKSAKEYPQPNPTTITAPDIFSEIYLTSNSGITADYINDIEVNSGMIKIATANGLSIFDGNNWTTINTTFGLPDNHINCVQTDGNITWLGTDAGLVKYDGVNITIYNVANSPIPTNKIRTLLLASDGKLWIGTFSGGGLASFDGTNWQVYTPSNSGLPNNSVSVITEANNGSLWIGTASGVSVFDGNNFVNYHPGNSDLPNTLIFDILIDNQIIWIASNGGLTKINGSTWHTYAMQNSGLPLNLVRSLAVVSSSKLCIGMSGQGVVFFNHQTDSWTHYNFSNSNLSNNYITTLAIDLLNNELYIGTENGLNVY